MGSPVDYEALRREFFGPVRARAPRPAPERAVRGLRSFSSGCAANRERLPPAVGRLLHAAAAARLRAGRSSPGRQQGIDIWQSGPIGRSWRRRCRWLCDLVARRGRFGILTSGGIRRPSLPWRSCATSTCDRLRRRVGSRRKAATGAGARGPSRYASDQTHSRSAARSTSWASAETLVVVPAGGVPAPRRTRCRGDRPRPRRRVTPAAIAAVAGSTNTGAVDRTGGRHVAAREGLWLHVDAAYGAAARLSSATRVVSPIWTAPIPSRSTPQWLFQAYESEGSWCGMARCGAGLRWPPPRYTARGMDPVSEAQRRLRPRWPRRRPRRR